MAGSSFCLEREIFIIDRFSVFLAILIIKFILSVHPTENNDTVAKTLHTEKNLRNIREEFKELSHLTFHGYLRES